MNPIWVIKLFHMWGLDFIGSFVSLHVMKNVLVVIVYVSKWVEAIAL